MATATPYLGLVKPAEGESYDVDIINDNNDKVDAGLKANKDLIDDLPQGIIKFADDATISTGLAGTSILNNLLYDITLKAGRTYRINYRCDHNASGVTNMAIIINFRHGAGTAVGGTALGANCIVETSGVSNQGKTNMATVTWTQATDTTALNVKAESARLTTTASYSISNRHLEIEDLGVI